MYVHIYIYIYIHIYTYICIMSNNDNNNYHHHIPVWMLSEIRPAGGRTPSRAGLDQQALRPLERGLSGGSDTLALDVLHVGASHEGGFVCRCDPLTIQANISFYM